MRPDWFLLTTRYSLLTTFKMVSQVLNSPPPRTLWGLNPEQLHARFWASMGVQVVRQGEPSQIVKHAELFLLIDPRSLPLFKLADVMHVLNWVGPQVLFIRVHDTRERPYRERVITEDGDRFVKFERIYDSADRLARVVITPDREIARLWQTAPDPIAGWRRLRHFIRRSERVTLSVNGNVFDRTSNEETAGFMKSLVRAWRRPNATIGRAKKNRGNERNVWVDEAAKVDPAARLIGNVWVGAGRHIESNTTIVGPTIIWDDPNHQVAPENFDWLTIEPSEPEQEPEAVKIGAGKQAAKRAFDFVASLVGIAGTIWMYPIIMLLIFIEDGRPFFFVHTRESRGGREFGCIKFRSMFNNSAEIQKRLIAEGKNKSDGGHVFIDPENDPRQTRIGKFLRKTNLDELPQFFNVLIGDMSIVGPRPSPNKENQYAPAWREARLSVRPGITGLWQISRTRRADSDFQEWIKYDLEYVETFTFWGDIKIIYKTIDMLARKVFNK